MQLISFNPYRTLDLPRVRYLKPERLFAERAVLEGADWVLFPEYWQVNALIYGFRKRIFPSASSYHLGHDKVEMTRALWSVAPAHVPWTEIAAATERGIEEILEAFPMPFVAKVTRASMGRGVFLVEERRQFLEYARANEVLYVQERLPIRRDLRVVWVGDAVLTAYWRNAAEGAFHNNLSRGGELSFDEIPEVALELVTRVARALGIDHAGFDLAEVEGHFYFLEFNTLFGNQGLTERDIRTGPAILSHLRGCAAGG